MAWTSPPNFVAGNVVTEAELDALSGDLAYLLVRPGSGVFYDNGAIYSSTSDTFTPIDATNLSITLTIAGTKILFGFTGVMQTGTAVGADFDVTIDGTRIGAAGANGLAWWSTGAMPTISFGGLVTGLSAGAHTLQVVWKRHTAGSGTLLLFSGNGVAAQDFIPSFWACEVG